MTKLRLRFLLASVVFAAPVRSQTVGDFVPASAANCALSQPPDAAGLFATPGGFVMVYPRNDRISKQYTGCKLLWVVDGERMMRLATLYFDGGTLSRVLAHDVRDARGTIEAVCDVQGGRSLMPNSGRRADDGACRGMPREGLYDLRVPTWPRRCLTEPDAPVCKEDPH